MIIRYWYIYIYKHPISPAIQNSSFFSRSVCKTARSCAVTGPCRHRRATSTMAWQSSAHQAGWAERSLARQIGYHIIYRYICRVCVCVCMNDIYIYNSMDYHNISLYTSIFVTHMYVYIYTHLSYPYYEYTWSTIFNKEFWRWVCLTVGVNG